jgi:hypothetical protein
MAIWRKGWRNKIGQFQDISLSTSESRSLIQTGSGAHTASNMLRRLETRIKVAKRAEGKVKLAKSRVTTQCCITRGKSFVYFTITAPMKDVNLTPDRMASDDSVLLECVPVSWLGVLFPRFWRTANPSSSWSKQYMRTSHTRHMIEQTHKETHKLYTRHRHTHTHRLTFQVSFMLLFITFVL